MHADPTLPATATRGPNGHLWVGGSDLTLLAAAHGTPLYICDEATLAEELARVQRGLRHWPAPTEIAYAGKAWLNRTLLHWMAQRGLGLDVVSEGELRYALHAGFDRARIHVHGNNKSDALLRHAIEVGVGRIVVDHEAEIDRLDALCAELGRRQALWLRLNPAVTAGTHAHITTGDASAKFGLSLEDGAADRAADRLLRSSHLTWRGVHFHLGSQMRDAAPIARATARVLGWLRPWVARGGSCEEFSPGAGWFVPYLPTERPLEPARVLSAMAAAFQQAAWPAPWPTLIVEPGRELVARAVIALYTVGALKRAGARAYAFVDGGLADNPRPALYGARYGALVANRESTEAPQPVTLAGPFCESGDAWPEPLPLPPLRVGDLLAVPMSGAYQLSMASNYNATPRPAVLWLREGEARLVQLRESFETLWSRDSGPLRAAPLHVPEKESM